MIVDTGFTAMDLERYLLILMRITSFIYLAPFFNTSNTPQRVRLGFSVILAFFIFSAIPMEMPTYQGVLGYTILVLKESAVGLLLGFSAYVSSTVIQFTGRMIDMEIGMSMATMFDPTTKTQSSLTGSLYQYMFLLLLIATDMHHFLLRALASSFEIIPLGAMRGMGVYDAVLSFLSEYFVLGFRLVLPIFVVTLLMNVILGMLARVAPQMNMFAVGIQMKVLAGLVIMFLTVGLLPRMSELIFTQMRTLVTQIMRGML